MRIFLDTANIEQIKQGVRMGIVSGVTTNPTLAAKEGNSDYEALAKQICAIVPGPVSVEVTVEGVDAMIKQAHQIAKWAPNVVIKVPATNEGLEVTSALAKDGIKVNFTLIFSVTQALMGARAGAAYVSPFVGRLDDISSNGMDLVADIVDVFDTYDLPTEVIAASLRHPQHFVEAARTGAHIATLPYNVLMQLMSHPLTDIGIKRFLDDWRKIAPK
jgi:transaldolase